MVTFMRLLTAWANQLFPAPAVPSTVLQLRIPAHTTKSLLCAYLTETVLHVWWSIVLTKYVLGYTERI